MYVDVVVVRYMCRYVCSSSSSSTRSSSKGLVSLSHSTRSSIF
jgi:hypothetical protein